MNLVLDTLFLRRPKINYVSPPVCEAIFSGTGSPIIILADIGQLPGPTGLIAGGVGNRRLSWNRYPGALCYNVYTAVITANDPCSGVLDPDAKAICECQAIAAFGNNVPVGFTVTYELLAECFIDPFYIVPVAGCYRVSAITPDGESDLSDPTCICTSLPSPVTVCNTSQTASCTPPLVGPDITVPAGVYCMEVADDPDSIAQAQEEMNAQAMAQAQSELACGSLPGSCANFNSPSGAITTPPSAGTTNIIVTGTDFDWEINIPGGATGGEAVVTHPVNTSADCNVLITLSASTYPTEASSLTVVLRNDGVLIGSINVPNFPFDPTETFGFQIPAGTTNLTLELTENSGFAAVNETWHGHLSFPP